MTLTIAVILALLILTEGALFALAPSFVKQVVAEAPDRLLAAAGVIEITLALILLYLLATG